MSNERRFVFGTLGENGDTFFIRIPNNFVLIDAPFDLSPELHKEVSTVGVMGIPPSAPGITKLLVDRLVNHDQIAVKAFELFESGASGSSVDQWLEAERQLLGM
jgi:hypothetical protein